MYAKKLNKVYPVNTPQEQADYLSRGFDICDDDGDIIAYNRQKTVPFSEYEALWHKYEKLRQELAHPDFIGQDPFDGLSPIPVFDPDKAKGNELKEFAKGNNIDLGDASKVEDIRAVVKAWISANADNDEDDGSPKVLTLPPTSGVMMGGGASVQVSGGSGQR